MNQDINIRLEQAASLIGTRPHDEILKHYLPELLLPMVDNSFSASGGYPLNCAVFNLEQGRYLAQMIAYFKYHRRLREMDVILANELDYGMKRSGNLNISHEFAKAIGMNYVYGMEFYVREVDKGQNDHCQHGNAIFSRYPLSNAKVINLPVEYEWFHKEGDSRLGTRIAIFAEIAPPEIGRIGLICVHLENRATPQGRERQLRYILQCAQEHFGDIPLLVGGDMNTNTVDGDSPNEMKDLGANPDEAWRRIGDIPAFEPLMGAAEELGLSYRDCNIFAKTTRRKPTLDGLTTPLNLDWFFQRGLRCSDPRKVESIFHLQAFEGAPSSVNAFHGQEMSDHDIVLVRCEKA
ncbi:MAG: endonuclease/exonuclease/phosphatase family protein [Christensenellaceae bacterium]|jgi:endonuclease/exonuclease/phosphatase family metal-dependent hydrolase|nr:endonuclease/exonuclease/phosphatase family protein [Christensenellaceae bacterium]